MRPQRLQTRWRDSAVHFYTLSIGSASSPTGPSPSLLFPTLYILWGSSACSSFFLSFSWYLILSSSSPYSVSRRPKEEPRPCIYRTAQSAVHRVSNSRLPLTRPALWRSNLFETAFFFFFFFLLFILNFI